MRSLDWNAATLLLPLSLLLAAKEVTGASFPRAVSGNGLISIPVDSLPRSKATKGVTKRASAKNVFETTIDNQQYFYSAEVEIGNPPQSVKILVDTGSVELWVDPDCTTVETQSQADTCNSFGFYDPSKSTTPPVGPFGREEINYGDASDASSQTSVEITYYADDISLGGGAKITNQTFGVVTQSANQPQGIIGLAPDPHAGFDGDFAYSLVLDTLASQGVINSRVFSLDLRSADDESGSLIYGGLDPARFTGQLETLPLVQDAGGLYRLATNLKTVGLTLDGQSRSLQLGPDDTTFVLDSGTTISRMHYAAAYPLLEALGAEEAEEGYYVTSCANKQAAGSMDFGFGDKTIRVPFSDFILELTTADDSDSSGDDQDSACFIGLTMTSDVQILGDTVLRAGYFVFDWDNQQVHVAQAATCNGPGLVAAGSGKSSIPSVTGACSANAAQFTGGSVSSAPASSQAHLPTQAATTVYTVTSCPAFDMGCQTGVVATQTIGPPQQTVTVTADGTEGATGGATSATATAGSSSGSGTHSAGSRNGVSSWMAVMASLVSLGVSVFFYHGL